MPSEIDLEAYLRRLGWTGPLAPTREVLKALATRHVAAIPFENLDPLLDRPVALDLPSLERKLVAGGRGGYCYEHNLLFAQILRQIGFAVTGLAARVLWGRPAGTLSPRTHMLLLVTIDGTACVADVGFGGLTLTGALDLTEGLVQSTAHERFRLVRGDGLWIMQADVDGAWAPLYAFDTGPQAEADYEIASYFLSTHPQSQFRAGLMAARAVSGRRYALLNRRLSVHHLDGPSEKRTLSADEVVAVLGREFGIDLSELGDLRARIEALPA